MSDFAQCLNLQCESNIKHFFKLTILFQTYYINVQVHFKLYMSLTANILFQID